MAPNAADPPLQSSPSVNKSSVKTAGDSDLGGWGGGKDTAYRSAPQDTANGGMGGGRNNGDTTAKPKILDTAKISHY